TTIKTACSTATTSARPRPRISTASRTPTAAPIPTTTATASSTSTIAARSTPRTSTGTRTPTAAQIREPNSRTTDEPVTPEPCTTPPSTTSPLPRAPMSSAPVRPRGPRWSANIGPGPRPWTDAGLAAMLGHPQLRPKRPVYYADSAAREQLARALERYVRREVTGSSYLL